VPREDLLDMIFSAFEDTPQYNLKSLTQRTNQPQAWLKEVLADVCTLHKRGPLSGLYELKPEYKTGNKK
jgi:transcription initiation factor TFIIF subunit beta